MNGYADDLRQHLHYEHDLSLRNHEVSSQNVTEQQHVQNVLSPKKQSIQNGGLNKGIYV